MSKFTAGKWKYLDHVNEVVSYPEGSGEWECNEWGWPVFSDGEAWEDITGELPWRNEEELHANGRLIAAAPEMYELLSDLLASGNLSVTDEDRVIPLLERIDGEAHNE